DHLGAVGLERVDLVFGDLVGAHEHALVAALLGDEREPDTRVAGGGLDDRSARLQLALGLGRVDDALRDAVLRAAARVHVLDLHEHRGLDSLGHPVEFHERRIAHQVEHRLGVLHPPSLPAHVPCYPGHRCCAGLLCCAGTARVRGGEMPGKSGFGPRKAAETPAQQQPGDHDVGVTPDAVSCSAKRRAYSPSRASSSGCVPDSTMRPARTTWMTSASTTVESRWAIAMVV